MSMMFEADAMQFPFLAEVTPKTSTRVQRIVRAAKAIAEAVERNGSIIPREMVAGLVGLTRQRIHQLIESGDLVQVEIEGHAFVTEDSLVEWLKVERKAGRPRKVAKTMAEATAIAREMVGQK
jgi:hypothetical protein